MDLPIPNFMCVQGSGSLLRHLKSHIEHRLIITLNLILNKLSFSLLYNMYVLK